ncbi:CLUMA_CG000483, isoform A [Clunio marinus]|uniref:CLUMA_CG000483, isoform A n=1 Tax=Clunio marinus TaxID=568069 RepID=A0A1J1HFA3_9DIPT|nr:CLUMA_CG000483, isoform A [Clunio marinus]
MELFPGTKKLFSNQNHQQNEFLAHFSSEAVYCHPHYCEEKEQSTTIDNFFCILHLSTALCYISATNE